MSKARRSLGRPATGGNLSLISLVLLLGFTAAASAEQALRDPTRPYAFRPAAAGTSAARDLSVTAIVVSPQRRVAVVNGRAVGRGERVAGAEVVEILSHAVRLRRGGRTITVPLTPTNVRRDPSARDKE